MIKYIATIILVLVFVTIKAQRRLELDEARELLNNNNNSLIQSELQEKIAQIDLKQAYNSLIPNLTFNVNNQHTMGLNFDQVTGQLITGNQWNNTSNATVSSSIFTFQGLRTVHNITRTKLDLDLAKTETEKLKYELELQLLTLFFNGLINADLYTISLEQAKLSARQVEQEEIKIHVGKGTLLDFSQAKSKLAADQLNISSTKKAFQLNLLKLKQLLELPSSTMIELGKTDRDSLLSENQHYYSTYHKDPYIQQIEKKIELSLIETKIAQSSNYPTLFLNMGYATNYSSRRLMSNSPFETMPILQQVTQNRSLYFGLGLSYNIFDSFNTKTNIRKSHINTKILNLEKNKITLERKLALEQASLDYQTALEEQRAIEEAYKASKTNYKVMNERYEVGKSSSIDLYKAITDFNINEFRKIANKYDTLLKYEILKILLSFDFHQTP